MSRRDWAFRFERAAGMLATIVRRGPKSTPSKSFRLASTVSAATIQDCNRGTGDWRKRRERICCARDSPWRKEICYRRTLGRGLPTRPCWQPFANGWGEKDDSRLGRAQRSAGGRRTSGLGASQSAGLLSQPTRRPGYRDGSVSGWDGRRCVAIENGRSGIGRRHRGLLEALRLGAAAGPCKRAA